MNKRLLACFALAFFCTPGKASAQFNDARAYDNTPVGVSQLELDYTYVRSNASLDPSLAIAGANLNLNQGTIGYTHYFGVFHRLAWVEAAVPLAGLDGSIAEGRSSANSHCLDSKGTSAILSTTEPGCLWIRAIRFAPSHMSTASHKITRNRISSWAVS